MLIGLYFNVREETNHLLLLSGDAVKHHTSYFAKNGLKKVVTFLFFVLLVHLIKGGPSSPRGTPGGMPDNKRLENINVV